MSFTDAVYFHNMSITYGNYELYTLNGGNDEYSIINKYDDVGDFVESHDMSIDGRTIFYNPNDDNSMPSAMIPDSTSLTLKMMIMRL